MLWMEAGSNEFSILFPGSNSQVHCFPGALALSLGSFSLPCYLPWLSLRRDLRKYPSYRLKRFLRWSLGTKGHFKFQIINLSFKFWFSLVGL